MNVTLNWRMALAIMLLPLLLAGLFGLGAEIQGLLRFDQNYFTQAYIDQYDTSGSVARALEGALQTDDQDLLAELQGLRRPAAFETSPKLIFNMLWDRDERYTSYLYFDMDTFYRHMYYFEEAAGRWVVSPTNAYFYWHSARWLKVFLPVAVFWWVLGGVALLVVWVYNVAERQREKTYG